MSANFNEWNEWNILPVNEISLKFNNDSAKVYEFSTLDSSTEFSFKFLTEDNDLGGQTPVALQIEGTISVAQNNFKGFKQFILDCLSLPITTFWLKLYSEEHDFDKIIDVNGPPQYGQDPRDVLTVENYEIIPEFSLKKPAAKVSFKVTGYLSLEIINTHYDLFFQQSWT
jgi:hypothetical protein